jgi:ribonuclease HI
LDAGAQGEEATKDVEAWTVFCDRSWGTFGAGAVAVLVASSKVRTCYAIKLDFSCTNNIAEYEALLLGLQKLKGMEYEGQSSKLIRKLFLATWIRVARQEIQSLKTIWTRSEDWKLLSRDFL